MTANTADKLVFQPLDAEMMVYDKQQDKVHVLNETANLILSLHQEGHSPAEIELKLKEHFSLGDEQNISQDISATLNQFKSLYLL